MYSNKIGFTEKELASIHRLDDKFWNGAEEYALTLESTDSFSAPHERLLSLVERVAKRTEREYRKLIKRQKKACEELLQSVKDDVSGGNNPYADGFHNGVVAVMEKFGMLDSEIIREEEKSNARNT